jgi:hypothetical protein
MRCGVALTALVADDPQETCARFWPATRIAVSEQTVRKIVGTRENGSAFFKEAGLFEGEAHEKNSDFDHGSGAGYVVRDIG